MSCGCDSSTDVLFRGNDQILVLQKLISSATDAPIVAASVHATLVDSDGNDVPGLTNLTMTQTGSPFLGDYSGQILGSQFNPDPGNYRLIVTAVATLGTYRIEKQMTVSDRTQ